MDKYKNVCMEFGKFLFNQRATRCSSPTNCVKYWPSEFQLMLGNLMKDASLYDEFLKTRRIDPDAELTKVLCSDCENSNVCKSKLKQFTNSVTCPDYLELPF